VHIAALPAAAVDTTGAGNCFCDTLAASRAEGQRNSRVVTTAR
jgi:sugar/nucleoside kinase (ribokinase family)